MKPRFVNCDRNTLFLMPPSVQDWLPDNHLARFVVDLVSRLDISVLENAYAGRGSEAYPPSMLLSLTVLLICDRSLLKPSYRKGDL
jgi:transposase